MRFEWQPGAMRKVLRSPKVQKWVDEETDKIVRDANKTLTGEDDGYKSSSMRTRRRYRSQVWADSPYARNSNAKHNTLMKMLMERDKGVPDAGDDE